MAKKVFIVLLLLILCLAFFNCRGREGQSETITITGAWALYPLVVRWSEEFGKVHPQIRINVSAGGAGKGVTDVMTGFADLGMVSRDLYSEETDRGVVGVVVARDAVVATANAANPNRHALLSRGLSLEACKSIWLGEHQDYWSFLAPEFSSHSLNIYTRSDSCGAAEIWAAFLGAKQEDLKGIGVYGDPGMAEAIIRDQAAIGYNNVNYAYDVASGKPLAGILVIPIDLDGSGVIEQNEDFYADRKSLLAAIADGAYPAPPARDLFLVHRGEPLKESVRIFLDWVAGAGREFIDEAGYVPPPGH